MCLPHPLASPRLASEQQIPSLTGGGSKRRWDILFQGFIEFSRKGTCFGQFTERSFSRNDLASDDPCGISINLFGETDCGLSTISLGTAFDMILYEYIPCLSSEQFSLACRMGTPIGLIDSGMDRPQMQCQGHGLIGRFPGDTFRDIDGITPTVGDGEVSQLLSNNRNGRSSLSW
jgi:hypothetical protein